MHKKELKTVKNVLKRKRKKVRFSRNKQEQQLIVVQFWGFGVCFYVQMKRNALELITFKVIRYEEIFLREHPVPAE